MSKKILSLALVVVMLMSTFALTAFAASGPLDSIGLKVVSNATAGMKAGEEVTVSVYYTVPDGADLSDYLHNASNIVLAYTDAYELNTDAPNSTDSYDARTWGASYADYFNEQDFVNTKTALFTTYAKSFTDNDKAKGWDSVVLVQQTPNTTNGYNSTSGYALDTDCEVFSLSFITTREVTADDTIGVPEASVTKGWTKICYIATTGKNGQYTKSTDVITLGEAVAAPAAEAKVEHEKTMGQMSNWTDATATTFNAGLVGRISNLDIKFDDNNDECETITDIIVSITYGDKTLTGNAYQLYEQADGSYLFRAVVRGADIADTTEFSYEYIVTLSDGSKLTYKSTENTSFSEIYNTAKANYDAANPAA